MSIPLKYSPFYGDNLPCIHAVEHSTSIGCDKTNDECKMCSDYESVTEYRINLSRSLKPTWKRIDDGTYYHAECSRCGERPPHTQYNHTYYSRYCPSCGHRLYSKDEEVTDVKPGVYQHFKGRQYEVIGVASHSETSEKFVVYRAMYGKYQLYTRPLSIFVEDVEDLKTKYRGPRFFKIDDED